MSSSMITKKKKKKKAIGLDDFQALQKLSVRGPYPS